MGRYSDRWQESMSKYDKLGCCGNLVRTVLFIINSLFLLFGLVVFIAAAVLKWGKNTFNKFTDIDAIDEFVKVGSIGTIAIIMMILSGAIILLSIVGILGVKYLSKFFLGVYEVIVGILFLTHLIAILVFVFGSDDLEGEYKKLLNNTVENVNNGTDFNKYCNTMKAISNLFKCCGNNRGSIDFSNVTLALDCCDTKDGKVLHPEEGCADKSVQSFKDNELYLVYVPSAFILGIEFISLIMVPCLWGKSRD